MIKNKKGILIIVVLLVIVYFVIDFVIKPSKGSEYNNTVFIGNSTKVTVDNGMINVYNKDVALATQKVKIYFNNKFIDGYIFSGKGTSDGVENAYGIYDEDNNYINTDSAIIAHTKDITIKVKEIDTTRTDDINEILYFCNSNNIVLNEDTAIDYIEKSSFDLNNDNVKEYVYSFGLLREDNNYESYVYYSSNNENILIKKEDSKYAGASYTRLGLKGLIDFNNDDKYEFVISRILSEYGPDYYELYYYNGIGFTKIGAEE